MLGVVPTGYNLARKRCVRLVITCHTYSCYAITTAVLSLLCVWPEYIDMSRRGSFRRQVLDARIMLRWVIHTHIHVTPSRQLFYPCRVSGLSIQICHDEAVSVVRFWMPVIMLRWVIHTHIFMLYKYVTTRQVPSLGFYSVQLPQSTLAQSISAQSPDGS